MSDAELADAIANASYPTTLRNPLPQSKYEARVRFGELVGEKRRRDAIKAGAAPLRPGHVHAAAGTEQAIASLQEAATDYPDRLPPGELTSTDDTRYHASRDARRSLMAIALSPATGTRVTPGSKT